MFMLTFTTHVLVVLWVTHTVTAHWAHTCPLGSNLPDSQYMPRPMQYSQTRDMQCIMNMNVCIDKTTISAFRIKSCSAMQYDLK